MYITLYDDDLATLLKKAKHNNYKLGKDFGILSFNESELKEVLDISVISTNFEQMGQAAANLILNRQIERIKNPFEPKELIRNPLFLEFRRENAVL